MTVDISFERLVCVVLLVLIGWLARDLYERIFEKPSGELVVDTTDPGIDKWFLKLYEPPEYAARKHIAKLKVSHRKLQEEEKWHDET